MYAFRESRTRALVLSVVADTLVVKSVSVFPAV